MRRPTAACLSGPLRETVSETGRGALAPLAAKSMTRTLIKALSAAQAIYLVLLILKSRL